jgi:hypothetical protein
MFGLAVSVPSRNTVSPMVKESEPRNVRVIVPFSPANSAETAAGMSASNKIPTARGRKWINFISSLPLKEIGVIGLKVSSRSGKKNP